MLQRKTVCTAVFLLMAVCISIAFSEGNFGGALRYNMRMTNYESGAESFEEVDYTLDVFRLNANPVHESGLELDVEYRFYSTFNTHFLHHGFFAYTFDSEDKISLGLSQVPFGLLPYAANSWWFQLPYYIGLEDDYDMGVKYEFNRFENLDIALAYYHTSAPEGPAGGSVAWGSGSGRYSYDIVTDRADGPSLREQSQGNVRAAYHLTDDIELGASGQVGGIYNSALEESELSYALSGHGSVDFMEHANARFEYIMYDYAAQGNDGQELATVPMGAYGIPYDVAAQGQVLLGGLSYTFLTENSDVINSIKPYVDYSVLMKNDEKFAEGEEVYDTHMLVPGVLVASGPIFTYIDMPFGKNHPWLTDNFGSGIGQGSDADWNWNFNINMGYYF
jgi:hypothetical protein